MESQPKILNSGLILKTFTHACLCETNPLSTHMLCETTPLSTHMIGFGANISHETNECIAHRD